MNNQLSVSFTVSQRKVIAEIAPDLAGRLKLDERNPRVIPLSLEELKAIHEKAGAAISTTRSGTKGASLRCVLDITAKAVGQAAHGTGFIPIKERAYQLKVTLKESQPPIWRRIQVKDSSLDKLHEHIQTSMGWTNSHLNHFRIGGQLYGDPMLMEESFEEMSYEDSTRTRLSQILPQDGNRLEFEYEYDFGDGWEHQIVFEGCLRAEQGTQYPRCLEGERACPPEDVGGVHGYAEFLEAIRDENHEEHEQMLVWVGGWFDPEEFDPVVATKSMKKGLPDWRNMDEATAFFGD